MKLTDIAWNEIKKCGIVSLDTSYETAKVLKISKTFPVPKVNFFKFLNTVQIHLNKKFSGKISLIGQGIFNRHKFIKELLGKF
jgi:hypothetical protein